MSALVSACSKIRPLEPRLSGGFKWARLAASEEAKSIAASREMETARELIEKEALEKETPEALHAYGRLLTLEGRPADGMRMLRKVVSFQPQNAQAINDLGVSLVQQEKIEDAFDLFEKAIEIASESREAIFNRALCYERLLLTQAAIAEYERVAKVEGESGWGREARERIEAISRSPEGRLTESEVIRSFESAMAAGNLDEARRIAGENFEALTKYALIALTLEHLNAALSGDRARSESALTRFEAIGRFFIETKGDRYIADSAAYLRRLPEQDRPAELRLINEYAEAVKMSNSADAGVKEAAFAQLASLAEAFRARGNHMRAERADLRIAKNNYQNNDLTKSVELSEKILSLVEKKGWIYEQADVLGHLGIVHARLGKDMLAIRYCDQARNIFHSMRERPLEGKMSQFKSLAYRRLGNLDNALTDAHESLRSALSSAPRLDEIAYSYLDLANIYRLRGNHRLALLYAEQSRVVLQSTEDFNRAAQALSVMALEQAALQKYQQANESLSQAIDLVNRIDSGKRRYTEPLILSEAGKVAFELGEKIQAIEYYSRAVSLASKTEDNKFLLINSLSGRAAAYAAIGDIERAKVDASRVVDMIENYRSGIDESTYRSSFLEASQNSFDQIIAINMASFGAPTEAFNLSERARGRALLDEIEQQQTGLADSRKTVRRKLNLTAYPIKLDQVQAALPEDLTLLTYSVTEKQTYIFIVKRGSFSVEVSPASAEVLDRLVGQYLSLLKEIAPVEELNTYARQIYDYLFGPAEASIRRGSRVCIVPDKALHFLPFPALVDRSGNYLNRSYLLSHAPSASVLAHCINEDRKKPATKSERITAVGNPTFDIAKFSKLSQLPESEREARQSASFYSDAIVLTKEQATEGRVLEAIKGCDVAHLAVHCLVESKSLRLAALVLAKNSSLKQQESQTASGDDGLLQLDELYNFTFPRTRLVVLSACQSALGQYYRGEGMVSLVRPFISSGVPTVVASLWPVDELATASLMVDFHKQRKESAGKVSESLRVAQINMSNSERFAHPYYWAPFIAIGSAN
ncbi:MAG TPA: CHAT domain-containing protein [Blastocatellia bacterium]|nr:CHAT domain-containing protein [Blastocatellia bacterium]